MSTNTDNRDTATQIRDEVATGFQFGWSYPRAQTPPAGWFPRVVETEPKPIITVRGAQRFQHTYLVTYPDGSQNVIRNNTRSRNPYRESPTNVRVTKPTEADLEEIRQRGTADN